MNKLVIPVNQGGKLYTHVDLKEPTPAVIADTQKEAESGNFYKSMHRFLSGSIDSIYSDSGDSVSDRDKIKLITRHMPFVSADKIALDILVDLNDDDMFEGIYKCPRCGHDIICELQEDEDTRDRISDLPVHYMDDYLETFTIDLEKPVQIKKKDEVEDINSIEFYYPTLQNGIQASSKAVGNNSHKKQQYIYTEAVKAVNGQEVQNSWKTNYGPLVIGNLPFKSGMKKISLKMSEFGVDHRVDKVCPKCGKEFKAEINTSNFFVSALESATM